MKKEKLAIILILAASVLIFLSFGLYHLSKFETVDEHFWKFERIPQYWDALKNKEWKKTYINDKPGITVAMISGIGLLAEPHPEDLRIRDSKITENDAFTVYDSSKTEQVNFALRLPILLFNGLLLFYFFWIIRKITDSDWIAVFSVAFMATSPILIGISQILNPDSLLWTFAAASIFSYFALIKTNEKKFIVLASLFTGLSLLSKYSANILFPFYLLVLFFEYFIYFEKYKNETRKYFSQKFLHLMAIFLGSIAVYSIFLPAIFVKIKYLYRGTIGAPGFSIITWPLLSIILLIFLDTLLLKSSLLKKIGSWLFKYRQQIIKATAGLVFLIFIVVILNGATGQKLIAFDKIKNDVYLNYDLGFKGLLGNDYLAVRVLKEFITQFYPFIFSIIPLGLLLVFYLWTKIIFKNISNNELEIFSITAFLPIYFLALLISNVSANIRYSIILYPLFAFLSAIALFEFLKSINFKNPFLPKFLAVLIILLCGITSLWSSRPFYFNYTNDLLPKSFNITDAWGYGEYEAAQYLNSLPDPEKIIVWSDWNIICQFVSGKCISDYKIDLTKVKPDYFIFSKRGVVRRQFLWKYPELAKNFSAFYYEKEPVWRLDIGKRPANFIKIIKSEE